MRREGVQNTEGNGADNNERKSPFPIVCCSFPRLACRTGAIFCAFKRAETSAERGSRATGWTSSSRRA